MALPHDTSADSAQPARRGRGRPRVSDAETIHEAARELFLEQGYDAVSVFEIARRAGVSRGTFFAYCDGKADALWGELSETVRRACDAFDGDDRDARTALEAALIAAVEPWGATPPAILRDAAAMGAADALRDTAPSRLAPLAERASLRLALERDVMPESAEASVAPVRTIAAAAAALVAWHSTQPRSNASDAVAAALRASG